MQDAGIVHALRKPGNAGNVALDGIDRAFRVQPI
jgi:hypothetical protein